jgi:hypothetical protein
LRVRLDRRVDRELGCHDNIATIHPGHGPHAAQLRCIECHRHRGWLSHETTNFLTETVRQFGVPDEPFLIHDAVKETNQMNFDDMYPSPYVKASDLAGKEITVTIEGPAARHRAGSRSPAEASPRC